jgi:hypothetical protein
MKAIAVIPFPALRLFLVTLGLTVLARAADPTAADPEARVFRSITHFIVANQSTSYALNAVPLPFVDWTLVQAGFVEYLNAATGQIVPLSGKHDLQSPEQVQPVPFAIPVGVRLRTHPATLAGSLASELLPPDPRFSWEDADAEVHTLLFDDADQTYKLWYQVHGQLAFATSKDLKRWDRPLVSPAKEPGGSATNLLQITNTEEAVQGALKSAEEAKLGNAGSFFIDPTANPTERYKSTFLARVHSDNVAYGREANLPVSAMTGPTSTVIFGAVSADGVDWRVLPKPLMLHDADTRTVVKWDAIEKQYVMYTRFWAFGRRTVARAQSADFRTWPLPVDIITPGPEQKPTEDYYATGFSFYPANPQLRLCFILNYDRASDASDVRLSTSRDGRVFHFSPGEPIATPSTFALPDGVFVSAAAPSFVRAPDGRMLCFMDTMVHPHKFPRYNFGKSYQRMVWWPADRLVGIEAESYGEFTTPPLKLEGQQILLNLVASRAGGVQVELRDTRFNVIPGHSFADADNLTGDQLSGQVTWHGNGALNQLRGKTIYLRFRLRSAELFSISAK